MADTNMRIKVSEALDRAIKAVGGLTELGKVCGVSKRVVWAWRDRGSIPAEYATVIEQATEMSVTCEELCPAIDWPYVRRTGRRRALRDSARAA